MCVVICEMAANNNAPLVTFFSLPQNQFQSFKNIEDITTFEFLASCDKVVEFIGMLIVVYFIYLTIIGAFGIAFTPVRHDVSGNVRKVRAAYTTYIQNAATLDSLLLTDKSDKTADAFIWLTRFTTEQLNYSYISFPEDYHLCKHLLMP